MPRRRPKSLDRLVPASGCLSIVALGIFLSGLAACARAPQDQTPLAIMTSDDLIAALSQAGAQVQVSSGVDGPVLEVPARSITVDRANILVYEYPTEENRQAVSAAIAQDPTKVDGEVVDWPRTPRVWVSGRLLIVYLGGDGGTILLLNGLLGDPLLFGESGTDEPYPPAVAAAIGGLASELGVDPAWIEVRGFDPVDWPDACLGQPGADEFCAEVITPGWRIEMRYEGTAYEAHTDQLGTQVRLK